MQNHATFSFEELRAIVNGEWLIEPSNTAGTICGICDDSRSVEPGCAFIAIPGEIADGHKYLSCAIVKGASCLVVSDADALPQGCQISVLLVKDSLTAFQMLGRAHRLKQQKLLVVGITGSCGKTSTKEMCAAVLQKHFNSIVKTEGNTNNHFGVPRNLLRLTSETQGAVIEMGSNHPGEIAGLVNLSIPDIAVVCNIGHAHLEFFKDLYGVATEKSAIISGSPEHATAIYPAEAVGVEILQKAAAARKTITFGATDKADIQCTYLGPQGLDYGLRLFWKQSQESREFTWPIGGAHQALNAAAAAAVGTALGMSPDDIIAGLQATRLPGKRMEILERRGMTWANDSYNANPDSTMAALRWFAEVCPKKVPQILVLGAMRELGDCSEEEHQKIVNMACEAFPQAEILLVGNEMKAAATLHARKFFENAQAVGEYLDSNAQPGSWILLKASNGVGLFNLIPQE